MWVRDAIGIAASDEVESRHSCRSDWRPPSPPEGPDTSSGYRGYVPISVDHGADKAAAGIRQGHPTRFEDMPQQEEAGHREGVGKVVGARLVARIGEECRQAQKLVLPRLPRRARHRAPAAR